MKIEIANDGKGKPQSYTATANVFGRSLNLGQIWDVYLTAYGATGDEAVDNLKAAARRAINEIAEEVLEVNALV